MALSEPHVTDEISDDQEATELFNTFMALTKDASIMENQANNLTEIEKQGKENTVDDTVEKDEKQIQRKESEEKTVEQENGNEKGSDLPDDWAQKENANKSLTKAVNELSDLEEQLSLMISVGPSPCSQEGNVSSTPDNGTVIETNEEGVIISVNEDSISHDAKESEPKSTETTDRETAWADDDADRNTSTDITKEFNVDEEKETSGEKNEANVDEAKDVKSEENTEMSTNSNEEHNKETSSESVQEEDVCTSKPNEDEETGAVKVEEKVAENAVSDNVPNEDTDTTASDTVSEQKNVDQENENVENPDNKVQDVKQDDAVDGKLEDAKEVSKESSSKAQDGKGNRESSSGADIEILMTDESGISARKSFDSLDSLDDNNHSCRPDSPALFDEGIDSDSKSDIADDDTFDMTSSSDFSSKSKTGLLEVDRNRIGSDSSTLSEQEFKRDLPDKTDGLNGETSDHIAMQGYLLKLGGSGLTPRNWRRRWFMLKGDNCLYYYKHSKDKVPCGVIILCNYSITKAPEYSRKCCFKLNKGGARSYHLCASNDNEMREWMVALMAAANEVAPDGSSFQISEGNVHNVSIPALSIRDPECHGYLSKQGHNIKNWRRRYCVLKNGYLYYYSDMSNTTALGVAKLLGYSIKMGDKRGKHYCFYASPPEESLRTYHFAAETDNDRERWMTRMSESIQKGNTSNPT